MLGDPESSEPVGLVVVSALIFNVFRYRKFIFLYMSIPSEFKIASDVLVVGSCWSSHILGRVNSFKNKYVESWFLNVFTPICDYECVLYIYITGMC